MLVSTGIFWLLASTSLSSAYLVDPPTTAPSNTISDCSNWAVASSTDTCQTLASQGYDLTPDIFLNYNPSLKNGCHIVVGDSYCVEENFGVPPVTSTSVAPTSTGNGVTTPSPIQSGMTSNCNKFYLVKPGDNCGDIASANGVSLPLFYSWNPAVGNTCGSLGAGDYVCVGVIGQTTSKPTTTSPANGISTPQPIQTSMVANCNKFYLVKSGDGCAAIASQNGITLAQFYAWNPAVGSSCTSLIASDYVCVGVIGQVTAPTTTTKRNGVSTPTPIQTGMAGNCNKFYLVVTGDSCQAIVSKTGVSLSQFYAWNPAVGSTCTSLIAGDYVCVGTIGQTTMRTTTTSKGNGISTPTPIQTGMTGSCNKFYHVASGDGCQAIATKNGISLSQFYSWNPAVGSTCASLIAGDYVCVGIIGFKPTTTTTAKSTKTTAGNGVSTPTPTQPGIVKNCKKFHRS